MIFQNYTPGPALRKFVKTYHLRHFIFSPQMKIPAKAFPPRAEQYLNLYVKGGEINQFGKGGTAVFKNVATITGQYTQLVNRIVTHEFLIIQVPFYPGALYQLTGIPFNELRDNSVELEFIYPTETREVNQKLQEAKSYPQMIDIVDAFLTKLYNKKSTHNSHRFDRIIHLMCQPQSVESINWLADQACLSIRQFERLSHNYFGVSPKMMTRIARFSSSYIMRNKHPEYPWLDIALACGYEDYQHMVRDYQDFAGNTPTQLWNSDLKAPEKILGLSQ